MVVFIVNATIMPRFAGLGPATKQGIPDHGHSQLYAHVLYGCLIVSCLPVLGCVNGNSGLEQGLVSFCSRD
jgi:hypothetical protein